MATETITPEAIEELAFTTPETLRRRPIRDDAEILAFVGTWEALNLLPEIKGCEPDRFALRLMTEGIRETAQTIYLRDLADW